MEFAIQFIYIICCGMLNQNSFTLHNYGVHTKGSLVLLILFHGHFFLSDYLTNDVLFP